MSTNSHPWPKTNYIEQTLVRESEKIILNWTESTVSIEHTLFIDLHDNRTLHYIIVNREVRGQSVLSRRRRRTSPRNKRKRNKIICFMIMCNESCLYNVLFKPSIVLTKINHVLLFGLFILKIIYYDCQAALSCQGLDKYS